MKRMLPALALALFACASASLAAEPVPEARFADVETRRADLAEVHSSARTCLRHTGSRIVRRDRERCIDVAGRAYTRDEIHRTGAVSVGEALGRLDPSLRVSR
jgi:hypothetical protein